MRALPFPNNDSPELISIPTLSLMLGVPVNTIRAWVYKRQIPYYKLGKLVRFNLKEIRVWVEAKKVQPLKDDLIREPRKKIHSQTILK